jgi:uncharacterized protein
MAEEIIEQIKEKVRGYFEDMPPSHDWSHVERVYELAVRIAESEKADLFIIKLAALLHDIGRKEEMSLKGGVDHAQVSREMASKMLADYNLNGQIAEQVLHCISSHRFRGEEKPKTLEARVLYDADKLDVLGAIGVARSYAWVGEQQVQLYSNKDFLGTGYESEHSPVTEFQYKLSKVKDAMQTETGRKIAQGRHKYILNFFERLKKEINREA